MPFGFQTTPNPGIGLSQDSTNRSQRSSLQDALHKLARRRLADQSSTSDVHAAFREGEKSPVAGASL